MPRCLECDEKLKREETLDGYTVGDTYEQEEIGVCPCCGARYSYMVEYKFSKACSFEKID